MKFKAAFLAVGLVAMTACGASASGGTFCIGPTAGMSLPTGNYGDAASTGWHGGVTCDYNMNTGWGFGGTAAYHKWSGSDALNAAAEAAFGSGSKIDWSAIQITPQASYHFRTNSTVKPYAMAGGYSNFEMDEPSRVHGMYGANYDRLAKIKAHYDPENAFQVNQNIKPA